MLLVQRRWISISAVPAILFAVAFASERLLDSLLLPRLQVEGVPLDVLDDVFLQYLLLKAS